MSEETAATRVFISYARTDLAFAEGLRDHLVAEGFDAFLDVHDIVAGEPWRERLRTLIAAADAVVFLLSPDSVASQVCDWEVNEAELLGKRIFPAVCRDTPMEDVPPRLTRLNFSFLQTPEQHDAHFPKLLSALAEDAAWVREHTRLGEFALRWDDQGRPGRLLLRGADIEAAETWRAQRAPTAPELSPLHEAFITRSRAGATRNQRRWGAGVSIIAVITAGLAVVAFAQRQLAVAEAERADAEAIAARAAERQAEQRAAVLAMSGATGLAENGDPDGALLTLLDAASAFTAEEAPDLLLVSAETVLERAAQESRFPLAPQLLAYDFDERLFFYDPDTGALLEFDGRAAPVERTRLEGRLEALAPAPDVAGGGLVAVLQRDDVAFVALFDPAFATPPREIAVSLQRAEGAARVGNVDADITAGGVVFLHTGAGSATLVDLVRGEEAVVEVGPEVYLAAATPQGGVVLFGDLLGPYVEVKDRYELERREEADEATYNRFLAARCLESAVFDPRAEDMFTLIENERMFGYGQRRPSCTLRGDVLLLSYTSGGSAGDYRLHTAYDVETRRKLFDISDANAMAFDAFADRYTNDFAWSVSREISIASNSYSDDGNVFRARAPLPVEHLKFLGEDTLGVVMRAARGDAEDLTSSRRLAVLHLGEETAPFPAETALMEAGETFPSHDVLHTRACALVNTRTTVDKSRGQIRLTVRGGMSDAVIRNAAQERTEILLGPGFNRSRYGFTQEDQNCVTLSQDERHVLVQTDETVHILRFVPNGTAERMASLPTGRTTSAFFMPPELGVVTSDMTTQVYLWSPPSAPDADEDAPWTRSILYTDESPVSFAQPDASGTRLLLHSHPDMEAFGVVTLFSLTSGETWRTMSGGYKRTRSDFLRSGDFVVEHPIDMNVSVHPVPTYDMVITMAEAALSPECRPPTEGAWRVSPCWPARFDTVD